VRGRRAALRQPRTAILEREAQQVATDWRTEMAKLTESKKDSMKDSQFGLPDERKYPMPDESHARNAKARASQQEKKGNLSKADERKIDRKADKVLKS
jgi:hypothetical protein